MEQSNVARLFLIGPPRLETSDGLKVEIPSKKAWALLAMLATANRCERSRVWLQQMLWGARAQKQAQSSLRRELSNLRSLLETAGLAIIESDQRNVRLKSHCVKIDFLHKTHGGAASDFLEGIDLAGEEAFEDWLREVRASLDSPTDYAAPPEPISSASPIQFLKPHIAIMPPIFDDHIVGARDIASRITRSLGDGITRLRWLPLVDIGQFDLGLPHDQLSNVISETLSVRYLVRIEVTGEVPGRAVNIALLEMPGRVIRWSETWQIGEPTDDVAFELEIARTINCLSASFDIFEQRHIRSDLPQPYNDLYDVACQVRVLMNRLSEPDLQKADRLLIDANKEYPAHSELLMLRASLAIWRHWLDRTKPRDDSYLSVLIRTAMRADQSDARGYIFQGVLDTWNRRYQSASQHLQHACGLDPSSAEALTHLGAAYYLAGDPESALAPLRRALFISPLDPKRFFALGELATALWMLERYEEALDIVLQLQGTHPDYILAHVIETASYSAVGRLREARDARARLLDQKPHAYQAMLESLPFQDRIWSRRIRSAVEFDLTGTGSDRFNPKGKKEPRLAIFGS